jgi:PAS domain S-box-containing protein
MSRVRFCSCLASATVLFIGLVALAGWIFEVTLFKSVFPRLVTMKFNTALCFVLAGFSLCLLTFHWSKTASRTRARRCAFVSAAVLLGVSGVTLAQYLVNRNLGVDELFFRDPGPLFGWTAPGRMGPTVALSFVLTALALFLTARAAFRRPLVLHIFGACNILFGAIGLLGYIADVALGVGWWRMTGLALHTTVAMMILGLAILLTAMREGTRWTVEKSINLGFTGALFLLVSIGLASFRNTTQLMADAEWLAHSHAVLARLDDLVIDLKDAEIGRQSYVISGRDVSWDALQTAMSKATAGFKALQHLTADNPIQQRRLAALEPLLGKRLELLRQSTGWQANYPKDPERQIQFTTEGKVLMAQIHEAVLFLSHDEGRLLGERDRALKAGARWTTRVIVTGSVLAFFLMAWAMFIVNRHIARRKQAEEEVRTSEVRYRRLFEAAHDGILIVNPATRKIVEVNPFMTELLGYSREEFLDKELWQIGLLANEKTSQAAFRELQEKGRVRYQNMPLQSKAGQRRDVEVVSNLYQEGESQVIQINIRDITARRQAEEALRASEELHRVVTDTASDAIIVIDESSTIISANRAAGETFGYAREELLGHSLTQLMPERHRAGHRAGVQRLMATREKRIAWTGIELPGLRKDGEEIALEISFGQFSKEGKNYFTGILRDITARKAAEAQLKEVQEELARYASQLESTVSERTAKLKETIAEMETFSYSLSHDMRAPLRAMRGFSEILIEDFAEKLGSVGGGYLKKIGHSALRLDQLIQDVLTYSRVGAEGTIGRVEVEKLVRDIIFEQPMLEASKAEIKIETPLLSVLAHEASLSQGLSNLLVNAVKFVAPGVVPRVRVRSERHDGKVRLWIEDNGIGIDPKYQERIFGMFQRLHDNKTYEGTGIGLAIVRKAVERMGGTVGVESEMGQGSRFWVELPGSD